MTAPTQQSCKTIMSTFTKFTTRALLQAAPVVDGGNTLGSPSVEEEPSDPTLDIRIAAIFCILVAGLAGGLPPLFMKVRNRGLPSDTTVIVGLKQDPIIRLF